jgi:hypothetical protein
MTQFFYIMGGCNTAKNSVINVVCVNQGVFLKAGKLVPALAVPG